MAPGRFQWNYRYIVFKMILEIGGWGISYEITLTWISLYLTDDKSTLVQVMTWCPRTASHYLSKCRPRSMSTWSQWVNNPFIIFTTLFSWSFYTTLHSANMPFHSATIFTLAHLLPLSLAHLQKTPFKLALAYNKSIADAHPSFLLDEAILFSIQFPQQGPLLLLT